GNGVQFSSSCLHDPCAFNNPPVATSPADTTMIVCDLGEICLPGFTYSDPDGNFLSVEVIGGTLDGETVCFLPVEGINTITLICTDACGAADTAVTLVTVILNSPPVITCINDTTVIISELEEICLPDIGFTDPDDNIVTIDVTGGYIVDGVFCFLPDWGINTVTIVGTDSCGATDICEFEITVGCCEFTPGDANSDGSIDLSDVTHLVNLYRFGTALADTCDCRPGNPIYPFFGAADTDGDCDIYTLMDIVYLIGYFRGLIDELFFCQCCPPTGGWYSNPGGRGRHHQIIDFREKNSID
ncbi:MAG: hypothetical protein V3S06_01335, partial [candidate division Zixibacteria bacterium]